MTVIVNLAFVLLALAAGFAIVRLLWGPTLADRAIALDTVLVILVCGLALQAAATGSGAFLDVMVVVALLGFVGTALVARFIERRRT